MNEAPTATLADIKEKYSKMGTIQIQFRRKQEPTVTQYFTTCRSMEDAIPSKALEGQDVDMRTE